MIAYEELVASLSSWRARNGLPSAPPDYGDPAPVAYADAAEESAPDEVYDLSDDSGLIMTEDVVQAGEMGVIETGVEIAQTAGEAADGDYDNPPGTDDYGGVAAGQIEGAEAGENFDEGMPDVTANDVEALPEQQAASNELYDDIPSTEAPVDTVDVDEAGVIEEQALDETLEADANDVVGEETVDAAETHDEPEPLDAPPPDDAAVDIDVAGIVDDEPLPPMDDEDDLEGETVVAGEPDESAEPEALPDMPGPDDEPPRE